MSNSSQLETPDVEPTGYLRELQKYLRAEEREIWDWIASQKVRSEYAASVKLELLKSSYRISRESASELYRFAEETLRRLGHDASVTLYQAQSSTVLNASLAWLPDEVHIVLHGPIQETLTESELRALFGHEIAHHILFSMQEGAYLIVDQVLGAMLGDRAVTNAYHQTWKHFKLYTELYCDRMTLAATGDLESCVSALVKLETGLKTVSARDYLTQAEEVLREGTAISEGVTHPEMFIRARALQLWEEDPERVEDVLREIIEGPLTLGSLDLLRQKRVSRLTRDLIGHLLAPEWMRTDSILAHAKQFFDDFEPVQTMPSNMEELKEILSTGDEQFRDYFCYVLLDFVTSDPDLEEAPLAASLLMTRDLGIEERFTAICGKELRLRKRQFESIQKSAARIVDDAEKQHTNQ